MNSLRYGRHVVVLGCMSAVVAAAARGLPARGEVFALYGALHAIAVIVSLRSPVAPSTGLLQIGLAAALSWLSFIAGLAIKSAGGATDLALACAAALGALSYGLTLRGTLGMRLGGGALPLIAMGCAAATCAGAALHDVPGFGLGWLAVLWWFGFSGGLWLLDRRHIPR